MRSVFVSSTFKDMHYERDAIKLIVEPQLNQEARKHGEEFYFCDLRWGINTGDLDTDEGSKKVLDVCLEEIDRCDPPMVVLLGDRYGWIPESDLIKTAADSKHFELKDLEKSVTALEIEYGALRDGEKLRNTLFYFRNIEGCPPPVYTPEDAAEEEKIRELKDSIRKMVRDITGDDVREYTLTWNGNGFDGIEDFAKRLAKDIGDMLMPRWEKPDGLTSFERERIIHDTYIREKSIMFKARQAEADELITAALSEPVTVITGEVGSGKSTLFCHMVTELNRILKETEWEVLPFISGLTLDSNSEDDIIQNIVYFMEEQLELIGHYIDEKDPVTGNNIVDTSLEWVSKFENLYHAYKKREKKLIIMVDAADQLASVEIFDMKLYMLNRIARILADRFSSELSSVHLVMTCTPDCGVFTKKWHVHELAPISREDRRSVLDGILTKNGRELSGTVIDEMLDKQSSDNPLYLSLIVQRLLMMNSDDFATIMSRGDGMAAIEQHQQTLIKEQCPDDLNEMNAVLLNEAGKRINEKLVSKVVECIAVSRSGLNRNALSKILNEEWAEYDFALFDHFVNYMNDCFLIRDDGCYDFTHKSIRKGFLNRCKDIDRIHRNIVKGMKSLKVDDPIRVRDGIYHTIKAGDKRFFIDYIIEWGEYYSSDSFYGTYAFEDDIYAQCIADNGQWIIDVLNEAKTYDAGEKLKYLLDFCYGIKFGRTDQEIRTSIYLAAFDLCEHLYNELNIDRKILGVSYDTAVTWYIKLGGKENLERAWEFYRKLLEIKPEWLDRSKSEYVDSWNELARMYGKPRSLEDLKRVQSLYNECIEVWEREESDIGYIRRKFVDSYRKAAETYKELGEIYEGRGMRCQIVGDSTRPVNLERALKLYLKHLEIRKKLAVEKYSEGNRRDLAVGYIKLARVYELLDGDENLEHAMVLYAIADGIKDQMEEEITAEEKNKEPSAESYTSVAEIYEELGVIPNLFTWPIRLSDLKGMENLEYALELYQKALEISVQEFKNNADEDIIGTVSSQYDRITAICGKMTKWYSYLLDLSECKMEPYQKELEINEWLRKELGSIESPGPNLERYLQVLEIKPEKPHPEEMVRMDALLSGMMGEGHMSAGSLSGMMGEGHMLAGSNPKDFPLSYAWAALSGGERYDSSLPETLDQEMERELEYRSGLANFRGARNAHDLYENLAEGLFDAAMHTSITMSDRKDLLHRGLDIAKELYEVSMRHNIGNADRYKDLIHKFSRTLARQTVTEQTGKDPADIENPEPELQQLISEIAEKLETEEGKTAFPVSYGKALEVENTEDGSLPGDMDRFYLERLSLYSVRAIIRKSDESAGTYDAYEDLARYFHDAAMYAIPSLTVPDRKDLISRALDIVKELYEKAKLNKTVNPDRYKDLIDSYSKALKEITSPNQEVSDKKPLLPESHAWSNKIFWDTREESLNMKLYLKLSALIFEERESARSDKVLQVFEVCEALAQGLFVEAINPESAYTISDRKDILGYGMVIAKELYEKARSYEELDPDSYKTLADKLSKAFGELPEEAAEEGNAGTVKTEPIFPVSYASIAEIWNVGTDFYKTFDDDLRIKLNINIMKALEACWRSEETLHAYEVHETLAEIFFDLAMDPEMSLTISDRKDMLTRGMTIVKELYEKAGGNKETDPDKYKVLIDRFAEALEEKLEAMEEERLKKGLVFPLSYAMAVEMKSLYSGRSPETSEVYLVHLKRKLSDQVQKVVETGLNFGESRHIYRVYSYWATRLWLTAKDWSLPITISDRRDLLERCLNIVKELYEKAQLNEKIDSNEYEQKINSYNKDLESLLEKNSF